MTPTDFVTKLGVACTKANEGQGDLDEYIDLWEIIAEKRKVQATFDVLLHDDDVMRWLKFAFRHQDTAWREAGIRASRSFFHFAPVTAKLIELDFIGSVLLITLPPESLYVDDEREQTAIDKDLAMENLQLLAAETICEMADYEEFIDSLCSTSVLNFLCIVLNQVPTAIETVTHTFVKLSENPKNLVVLMEGAVGDILESFLSTTKFVKPAEDEEDLMKLWKQSIPALGNCAHVLGTLLKYNHDCQVDKEVVIEIFEYVLGCEKCQECQANKAKDKVDKEAGLRVDKNVKKYKDHECQDAAFFVRLLAEMSRLFYWVCRRSKNVPEILVNSCPTLGPSADYGETRGLDRVLTTLVRMWNEKCVGVHSLIEKALEAERQKLSYPDDFLTKFCVHDLDTKLKLVPLPKDKEGVDPIKEKIDYAQMRLCYMNCTLWILLPIDSLRWKLQKMGLTKVHLAFDVRKEALLQVIVGTVRHLVDRPEVQQAHDFIKFFAEQLVILLDLALLDGTTPIIPESVIILLLDAISMLAMSRSMQELLAEFSIYEKLQRLVNKQNHGLKKHQMELTALRTNALIAMHPSHRYDWVAPTTRSKASYKYPDREEFMAQLEKYKQRDGDTNFSNLAALVMTVFKEEKFKKPLPEAERTDQAERTYQAIFNWWQNNTTARFDEEKQAQKEITATGTDNQKSDIQPRTKSLEDLLRRGMMRIEENRGLTIVESTVYCAPHECVLALSLFARLALEPRFKKMISKAIEPLLGCVCVGVWAEAREAAACLANLMWVPDLNEERLVCWLKFDGPRCHSVDGSNVLLPIKVGHPKPADIGKGMYRSSWGIEFVEGSSVTLHPDGLKTYKIPGLLTSASPTDSFANTSKTTYQPLDDEEPKEKNFSITCWFYWPISRKGTAATQRVLLQTCPHEHYSQIYLDWGENTGDDDEDQGTWVVQDDKGDRHRLKTPKLNDGWHMLALVSCTSKSKSNPVEGTKFFLDDWHCLLHLLYVKNEFYMVGNDSAHGGKKPFGLITDFRIYARTLADHEIEQMVRPKGTSDHPDRITRQLASMNAATILAQRLDVPDSAAECLRALGSLATLSSQRAKIFSVCGPRVLEMLESPLPMIHRQAARLVNNIT